MNPLEIINLCPHDITLVHDSGRIDVIKPSLLGPARVEQKTQPAGDVNGFPVEKPSYGIVTGLPPASIGVVYVTSLMVAQAANRLDVLSPGEAVRDESGRIIGCRTLHQHCPKF